MPNNRMKAQKILTIIKDMEKGDWPNDETPTMALYDLLGDDQLFDQLDLAAKPFLKACAEATKKRIKQFAQMGSDEYSDPKDKEQLDWLAKQL